MAGTKAASRATGLGYAIVSAVSFGAAGPFGKALINAGLTPFQAVWLRIAGAVLLLVPLAVVLRGTAAFRTARRFAPQLVLYGVAGVAACQAFFFVAASRLPVGVAILLEFTGPVLVVGWVRFVRGAAVHRSAAVGVGVALVGLACVTEVWSGLSMDPLGLLAGLCAAASQAVYFLVTDRLTGQADPLVMTAAGGVVATLVMAVPAAPWALRWSVLSGAVAVGGHHAPGWVLAAWLVAVCTATAYLTGVAAVQRLSAPIAGAVAYSEAVAATLIAWIALGERLDPAQLAGGAIVLAGAFIAQRAVPQAAPAQAGPAEGLMPAAGWAAEPAERTYG